MFEMNDIIFWSTDSAEFHPHNRHFSFMVRRVVSCIRNLANYVRSSRNSWRSFVINDEIKWRQRKRDKWPMGDPELTNCDKWWFHVTCSWNYGRLIWSGKVFSTNEVCEKTLEHRSEKENKFERKRIAKKFIPALKSGTAIRKGIPQWNLILNHANDLFEFLSRTIRHSVYPLNISIVVRSISAVPCEWICKQHRN